MYIKPNWPAPTSIKALTTLRYVDSTVNQCEFNLATTEDGMNTILTDNRVLLQKLTSYSEQPTWIKQVHSNHVVKAQPENRGQLADASWTDQPNSVCAILTADCLPVLLCNKQGTLVAAVHAGWRGLSLNIIQKTLDLLDCPRQDILAWLGPAISQPCFEVGEEVRHLFISIDSDFALSFIPSPKGRWLANLYQIATLQLKKANIKDIYGGEYCTFSEKDRFFSYRRDGKNAGRMASLIWISSSSSI